MAAPARARRTSPLPLAQHIGPHGALTLALIEDHKAPEMRIYDLSEVGGPDAVGMTGEELDALCSTWQAEKQRGFIMRGVVLP